MKAGGKQNNVPAGNPGFYRKQKESGRVEFGSCWLNIRQNETTNTHCFNVSYLNSHVWHPGVCVYIYVYMESVNTIN
jgi:hypothetical protein